MKQNNTLQKYMDQYYILCHEIYCGSIELGYMEEETYTNEDCEALLAEIEETTRNE